MTGAPSIRSTGFHASQPARQPPGAWLRNIKITSSARPSSNIMNGSAILRFRGSGRVVIKPGPAARCAHQARPNRPMEATERRWPWNQSPDTVIKPRLPGASRADQQTAELPDHSAARPGSSSGVGPQSARQLSAAPQLINQPAARRAGDGDHDRFLSPATTLGAVPQALLATQMV